MEIADQVEAVQHSLLLRGTARTELLVLVQGCHLPTGRSMETPDHTSAAYG
jgi:hypothetical protein